MSEKLKEHCHEVVFNMKGFHCDLTSYAQQNSIDPQEIAEAIKLLYGQELADEFLEEYKEWTE